MPKYQFGSSNKFIIAVFILMAGLSAGLEFANSSTSFTLHASEVEMLPKPTTTLTISNDSDGQVKREEGELDTPSEVVGADELVGKYADIYGRNTYERSRLRGILHCLLNVESKHGADGGHGDNGMAGGPLQFWEDTYIGYRKIMMKEGLVDEIGSRYDLENAIETTAWAITDGRGKAWGPILRWEKGIRQGMECPNL